MLITNELPKEILWEILIKLDSVKDKIHFLRTCKRLHNEFFAEYRENLKKLLSGNRYPLDKAISIFEQNYNVYNSFMKNFQETVAVIDDLERCFKPTIGRKIFLEHKEYVETKCNSIIKKIDDPNKYIGLVVPPNPGSLNPILAHYLILKQGILADKVHCGNNIDDVLFGDWSNMALLAVLPLKAEHSEKLQASFQSWIRRLSGKNELVVTIDANNIPLILKDFKQHFLAKERVFQYLIEEFKLEKAIQYIEIVKALDPDANAELLIKKLEKLKALDPSYIQRIVEEELYYILSSRISLGEKYFEKTRTGGTTFTRVLSQATAVNKKFHKYFLRPGFPKMYLEEISVKENPPITETQLKQIAELSREENIKDWSLQDVKSFMKKLGQAKKNKRSLAILPAWAMLGFTEEEILKTYSFMTAQNTQARFDKIHSEIADIYHVEALLKYLGNIERLVKFSKTKIKKCGRTISLLKLYAFWPELTQSPLFKIDPNNIDKIIDTIKNDAILKFVVKYIDYIVLNFNMFGDYATLERMINTPLENEEWYHGNEALLKKYYSKFKSIKDNIFTIFKKYIEMIIDLDIDPADKRFNLYKEFSIDQFKQNLSAIHLMVSAAQAAPAIRTRLIGQMKEVGIPKFFTEDIMEKQQSSYKVQSTFFFNKILSLTNNKRTAENADLGPVEETPSKTPNLSLGSSST